MTPARDPETIQREIETTRAQLASTFDELAERASPKRVAARGVQRLTGTPAGRAALGGAAGLVVAWIALKVISRRRNR